MRSIDKDLNRLVRCAFLIVVMSPCIVLALPTKTMPTIDASTAAASTGRAALMQGVELFAKGDLAGAEKSLNEGLKLDPALVEIYLVLAEIRLRQNRFDDAEAIVRKAMTVKPNAPNILVALGNVLLLKKSNTQAEEMYRKALAINKDHVPAYLGLGELYLRALNKPKEAITAYRRAAEINPNLPSAHFALGTAYAAAKQKDEAIAAFQKAAKLTPTDPQAMHAIGRLQASEKKLDLAVTSFTEALTANASYQPALIDRADALAELGRNQEAVLDYENAVRKQADNAQLWLKLALINDRLKRKDEAIDAYKKALSFNSSFSLAYNNLAWLTMENKSDLDQALAWSIQATSLAPKVPQFYDTLGWIYRARGELEMARKSLETATRLTPPQADAFYHLGVVLQEQGKTKEARAALTRALQIDKGFANAADADRRLGSLAQ